MGHFKKMRLTLVSFLALIVGSSCVPFAHKEAFTPGVFGTVVDAETGKPVAGAKVVVYNFGGDPEFAKDTCTPVIRTEVNGSFFLKTKGMFSFGLALGLPSHVQTPAKGELVVYCDGYEDFKKEVTIQDDRNLDPVDAGQVRLSKKK